jgi:uncharacterized protein YdhG (YjbR/CyaY superfamily)
MPYRRLPNTDKARLRALNAALRKSDSTEEGLDIACSEGTIIAVQEIIPKFESAVVNLDFARKQQNNKNKEYLDLSRKARLYISHFIQVLNFSILRGEMKSEVRDLYSLTKYNSNLPPLTTDKNLIDWGKTIIEGEQQRILKGGNPIYNPSIALVKVNYEKFIDSHRFQTILIANTKRLAGTVSELRKEADKIILNLWNEVEKHFEGLPESEKREMASEYGLVYVWRKKELRKLKEQKEIANQVVHEVKEQKREDIQSEFSLETLNIKPSLIKEHKRIIVKKHKEEPSVVHSPVQAVLNF